MDNERQYLRFNRSDRLQHALLLISFTLLALTGLPQKYADARVSIALIRLLGGIERTRQIHHTAAVVLILLSIFHLVAVGYRVFVLRVGLSMLPTLQDFRDFVQAIRYNLNWSTQRPRFPRYNFIEKLEYWAVVWGTVLMTLTGYILWNPILATRYLPGEVIPAAKTVHGLEALLAVLSIITWHSYFVHFTRFNKSIFTGHLSQEEMEEEHAGELEDRLRGAVPEPPPPAVRWRRLQLYTPLATLFTLVALVGTWRFLTVEQTAINTVPRIVAEQKAYQPVPLPTLEHVGPRPRPTPPPRVLEFPTPTATPTPVGPVSVPLTPTPTEATPSGPGAIPHAVNEGTAHCNQCHGLTSAIAPAPLDHKDRSEDTCLLCHRASEEVGQ